MSTFETTLEPSIWKVASSKPALASELKSPQNFGEWKGYEKILFRFFFIYFLLQALPLDWKFYQTLFAIDWADLYYGDIFVLARYQPQFFGGEETFANWLVIAVLAIVGAVVWSYFDRSKKEYTKEYYWLRVILRYRLAIAVIAYGFIKLFPLQAPFPSISNLNTAYGDLTNWKMFALSLGVAPTYEVFLGAVEIFAGLLLLFRRTATIGAFIIIAYTGNIFLSNLAYEGGEYVYSSYLIAIAVFLFAFDARRLVNLLSFEKPTLPNSFKPSFQGWQRQARLVVKGLVLFFFVFLYGYKTYSGYKNSPHHIPQSAGLKDAAGIYDVSEFKIDGVVLPYSVTDPIRWKDVVFEKWATISIKSNRPVIIEHSLVEKIAREDKDKTFELSGSQGRHYYIYTIDEAKKTLTLQNKNENYHDEKLILSYSRPDASTIVLSGLNENKKPIEVTLKKINKKYLLIEGRRKPQKL